MRKNKKMDENPKKFNIDEYQLIDYDLFKPLGKPL